MDLHQMLTALACAGHLSFAALAWRQRGQNRIAVMLAVLFLDLFVWNFADLAAHLSGVLEWGRVDRCFSSLMPAITLEVVVIFVGRARALRSLVRGGYFLHGLLALWAALGLSYAWWWKGLLAVGTTFMLRAIQLLLEHVRRTEDARERTRTRLVLFAIGVGTLVGSTDLWAGEIGLPALRLSNLGTLLALGLFATAALRLDLLGGGVITATPVLAALGTGSIGLCAYLAAIRFLPATTALWSLGAASGVFVAYSALGELARSRTLERERTERFALVGRFSTQLAHDLKNPIAALKGALQFLSLERSSGRSLDGHAEFLDLMLEQCNRLQRTVEAYQRLGKLEPIVAPCQLNELVRRVLTLQSYAKTPNVVLTMLLDDDLPESLVDPDLVTTALENVLQNACEALNAGGTVVVRTERLGARDSESQLSLSVEDDGPGMDPRVLERATEGFFTTKPQGSGLGLAFAARVARAHGGQLQIESALGRGTRVRLRLPIGAAGAAQLSSIAN